MPSLCRGLIADGPALALALAAKLGTSVVGAVGFYVIAHSALLLLGVLLLYLAVMLFSRGSLVRFARAAARLR